MPAIKGRPLDEEHKRKISEAAKARAEAFREAGVPWPAHRGPLSAGSLDKVRTARAKYRSNVEAKHNHLLGKRVKLSAAGLVADGLLDRGFDEQTRGTCVLSEWPDSGVVIAVYVDGLEKPEHWRPIFWEAAE
jgi:hypothetical protein